MNKQTPQSGAAMVEFALVLIPLLLIVFGITELGRALYQQNSLVKSVHAGARYIARQPDALVVANPCTPGVTWTQVSNNARNLVVCGRTSNCNGATTTVPGMTTTEVQITTSSALITAAGENRPACIIQVAAEVPFQSVFGERLLPIGQWTGLQLRASIEERYIGE
ncbi:TadE-like protein [Ectothiorhodosinus mongolicus]|uniref:TadE-like protein n=1 Tax=Ectothiorhodosinus mongolicus TaxID=233100 RepID=A0A1R3VPZ7_9GAMM|nr:TadE family protein [Ectothiorhodosinus mongolicus]SIT65633.1 TadE-like protein [Ectothiorhodosinus mongolicus]